MGKSGRPSIVYSIKGAFIWSYSKKIKQKCGKIKGIVGKKAKSKPLNNMGSFCDDRFSNLRNIFADVYSNSGVLSDTPSVSFEKKNGSQ